MKETLNKFVAAPGLCSQKELKAVKDFLIGYCRYRDLYLSSWGHDPLGFTLEGYLEKTDWYLDRLSKKNINEIK